MIFSFFRPKVNIHSIDIPTFGWRNVINTDSTIQWVNQKETIALSKNFFSLPPDIPTVRNLHQLISFYRNSISEVGGGIIEVDIVQLNNVPAVLTIFKVPQEPSGVTYLASITIPFENCSYVIKVQCIEVGITGLRESFVANKLLASGEITIGDNGYENWFFDPYDASHKGNFLMNKSESSVHDKDFPNHPLTQARIIINNLKSQTVFKTEIAKIRSFNI